MRQSKTSSPDFLAPSYQHSRVSQTTKQSTLWKLFQSNARAIDTHLGGAALGHLGLIVSYAPYAMVSPATEAGPTLWVNPTAPGRAPENTDSTEAQISAARHSCSYLPHLHLCTTGTKKTNHHCF
jgi:hypothetical protein